VPQHTQAALLEAWVRKLCRLADKVLEFPAESAFAYLNLEVAVAVVDFPLSLLLQLWPLPDTEACSDQTSGPGPLQSNVEVPLRPGASGRFLIGAPEALQAVMQHVAYYCNALASRVERWDSGADGPVEIFLRRGVLLRWLRGLHLLSKDAADNMLVMAAFVLYPYCGDDAAGGDEQPDDGPCLVEPALAEQVRVRSHGSSFWQEFINMCPPSSLLGAWTLACCRGSACFRPGCECRSWQASPPALSSTAYCRCP
jgi:hypothetical protein